MPGLPLNEADANALVADIANESARIADDTSAVESLDQAMTLVRQADAIVRGEILPTLQALDAKRKNVERLRRDLAALQGRA